MADSKDWTPAFPGQRPPFPEGNTLSLRHGAFSDRRVIPIADSLTTGVLDLARNNPDWAYLAVSMYRPAIEAWARAEARVHLLTRWLEDHPPLETEGGAAVLNQLKDWETRAEKARTRLGLDPLSRARLGKDVAQTKQADMAALMAELYRRDNQDRNQPANPTTKEETES